MRLLTLPPSPPNLSTPLPVAQTAGLWTRRFLVFQASGQMYWRQIYPAQGAGGEGRRWGRSSPASKSAKETGRPEARVGNHRSEAPPHPPPSGRRALWARVLWLGPLEKLGSWSGCRGPGKPKPDGRGWERRTKPPGVGL